MKAFGRFLIDSFPVYLSLLSSARSGRQVAHVERFSNEGEIKTKQPLEILPGKGIKLGDSEQSQSFSLLSPCFLAFFISEIDVPLCFDFPLKSLRTLANT